MMISLYEVVNAVLQQCVPVEVPRIRYRYSVIVEKKARNRKVPSFDKVRVTWRFFIFLNQNGN